MSIPAIDWQVTAIIAAPIIALIIGALLENYFGRRPKIIAYLGHVANFVFRRRNEEHEDMPVYTHSLVVRNAGRRTAENVRIGHHLMPDDYTIFPSIDHSVSEIPETGPEIHIPMLVPNEEVTISYLYFEPLQTNNIHSYIKSDNGFAKVISVITQQQFPRWFTNTLMVFCVIGFIATIYITYAFIW